MPIRKNRHLADIPITTFFLLTTYFLSTKNVDKTERGMRCPSGNESKSTSKPETYAGTHDISSVSSRLSAKYRCPNGRSCSNRYAPVNVKRRRIPSHYFSDYIEANKRQRVPPMHFASSFFQCFPDSGLGRDSSASMPADSIKSHIRFLLTSRTRLSFFK